MELREPDFSAIFNTWPAPAAILDADLKYIACNAAYEAVSHRPRDTLVGQALPDMFPGNGGARKDALERSLRRVLRTKRPHHLPSARQTFTTASGRKVERNWTVSNIPLLSGSGELTGILHCPLDTTRLVRANVQQPLKASDNDKALAVRAAQTVLSSEGARLQELFHQAPGFICVLEGPHHVYELANDAYYQLVGHREIIGQQLADVLPEVVSQGFLDILDKVYRPYVSSAPSRCWLMSRREGPV